MIDIMLSWPPYSFSFFQFSFAIFDRPQTQIGVPDFSEALIQNPRRVALSQVSQSRQFLLGVTYKLCLQLLI